MSAIVDASAARPSPAGCFEPAVRLAGRESADHIQKTIIIVANISASPATHMAAPPACRSWTAVPAQAGRAPIGRPGVP
jgi:hypothetical protein